MASRLTTRSKSLSSSQPPPGQRLTEDPLTPKTGQSCVTCGYQTYIGDYWRTVTVFWSKNLMNHSMLISVDSVETNEPKTCKIELKPWHFWAKKGYKTFEVDGNQLEVYWDLRSAKFTGGPEPSSDFYVALVSDEQVVLLVGDYKKKAYKRTKSRPAFVDGTLYYKKENCYGKKSFSTRAKFDPWQTDHDIVVESKTSGPEDPEMWISIDGIVLLHIQNLQWKFRGNHTVLVNKQPIQVFWDVYPWLFCNPGSKHGLFIFKPGALDIDNDDGEDGSIDDSESSADSHYYSTRSHSKASPFCLFLYAWKIE